MQNSTEKSFENTPEEFLEGIKIGTVDVSNIPKDKRQEIVMILNLEGCTQKEIAGLLGVSAQTIYKDLKDIKEYYLAEFEEIKKTFWADYHRRAEYKITKLTREGQYYKAAILHGVLIKTLMKAGIIPKNPQKVKVESSMTLVEYLLRNKGKNEKIEIEQRE